MSRFHYCDVACYNMIYNNECIKYYNKKCYAIQKYMIILYSLAVPWRKIICEYNQTQFRRRKWILRTTNCCFAKYLAILYRVRKIYMAKQCPPTPFAMNFNFPPLDVDCVFFWRLYNGKVFFSATQQCILLNTENPQCLRGSSTVRLCAESRIIEKWRNQDH